MGYYIDQNGSYYEGDQVSLSDQEVPQRPDANHTWNGSAWQAVPVNPTETIVSPAQIREALLDSNLLDAVEAAVSAGSRKLQIWWEFATQFERNHPLVISMATTLGVSEEQLDQLFALAATK